MVDLVVPSGTPTVPVGGIGSCPTTTADLIERTKRHFLSGFNDERNKLAAQLMAGVTSMSLSYDRRGIKLGARVSIELEDLYVWDSADGPPDTATIERGQYGTIDSAHGLGAVVTVRPKISDFEIVCTINDVLDELTAPGVGLYWMRPIDLTYDADLIGYDLPVTDMIGEKPWKAYWKLDNDSADWPEIENWRVARHMDPNEFASGYALFIDDSPTDGQPIRVLYRAPFARLSTSSADLGANVQATTGLHCQAHDLLHVGAALRLAEPREIKRNFTERQGDSRRAEEVPPGAVLQSPRALAQRFERRSMREAGRLRSMYPDYKQRY